jgi:hypothetical protein
MTNKQLNLMNLLRLSNFYQLLFKKLLIVLIS